MKLKLNLLILSFLSLILGSCSKDDHTPTDANDNFITVLTLTVDNNTYTATIEGQNITVAIPYNVSLTSAIATIEYTPSASINPDPAKETIDWNREQVFIVTSYNGEPNEYTYHITREEIEKEGDVVLRTMNEIASFAEEGTSVIDGNLTIGTDDGEDITSIEKLSNLKAITGNLILKNSFKAKDLTGLEQVTTIGGLLVGTKEAPSSAELNHVSMQKLTEVTGDITIWNNTLQWLELKALTKAGSLSLASEALESIELPALTEVENDFIVEGCLERVFKDKGTTNYYTPDLKGNLVTFSIPNLRSVGGIIGVNFIAPLKTIALANLETAKAIDFGYLPMAFESLSLRALRAVEDSIKICSTKTVQAIGGYITYNESLTTLGDWPKLEKIGGVLTLMNFGALTTIPEMTDLQQSGGFYLEGLTLVPALNIPKATFVSATEGSKATIYISRCPALLEISAPKTIDAKLELNLTNKDQIPAFKNKTTFAEVDIYFQGVYTKDFEFTNWEKVTGNFSFELNSTSYAKTIALPDLIAVDGYLSIAARTVYSAFRPQISLPKLVTVGGQLYLKGIITSFDFTSLETVCCAENPAYAHQEEATPPVGSINIRSNTTIDVTFPALTRIGGRGLALQSGKSLSCPVLTEIDGSLILNSYNGSSVEMPALTKLGGAYFYKSTSMSDFTPFGKFIENIAEANWTVTGCGYNPTYEDMKAGRYTPLISTN
jgi:hypothetical protein